MFIEDNLILKIIETGLDVAVLRHNIYSTNIANVDTPGYKKYRVEFEEILKNALEGNAEVSNIEPKVYRVTETSFRNDGNNVNLDEEIALINQNFLKYQALSQFARWHFDRYYTVLGGRKR
ncbi:MAG: flagellar basal body protein [bacterium]|nr:flagellar basal body protein [bacterium]